METSDRFWKRVDKHGDCWIWLGGKTQAGYGYFWHEGTAKCTHRFVWESLHGGIPEGKLIRHSCNTRSCVNPQHLFLGSQVDNMRDAARKGKVGKLTRADVRSIRRHLARGEPQERLARRYSVSQGAISHIATGRTWGWLDN